MTGSLPEPAPTAPDDQGFARPDLARRFDAWRREPRVLTWALALVALIAGAWWVRSSMASGASAPSATEHTTVASRGTSKGNEAGVATTTTVAVFVVDVVGAVR